MKLLQDWRRAWMVHHTLKILESLPENTDGRLLCEDGDKFSILLDNGIEELAKTRGLELSEAFFPAEGDLPACVARLVTVHGLRVWQFDELDGEA